MYGLYTTAWKLKTYRGAPVIKKLSHSMFVGNFSMKARWNCDMFYSLMGKMLQISIEAKWSEA